MPFRKYSNFEKCKIAREKKSDVILHILSFYGAPSLFCPASPWPLHSQNPGAAAAQIAPEVIFVKPEVKFLSPEMAFMGHLCVFNALKGLLRAQKREKSPYCIKNSKM